MKAVVAARAAYGAALMAAPQAILKAYGAIPHDGAAVVVARVLGVRHLLQGLIQRGGAFPRVGASADALHALTMFGLAAVNSDYRRPALIDGTIASAFAGSGMLWGLVLRER